MAAGGKSSPTKVLPITPKEAKEELVNNFPEWVIEGVNNAIKKNFFGKESFSVKKKEIEKEILAVAPKGITTDLLYEKHYMDFEDLFRKFGWKITFESPDRDENFDDYFSFSVKKWNGGMINE